MASSQDLFWNGERQGVSPPCHRIAHILDHSLIPDEIFFLSSPVSYHRSQLHGGLTPSRSPDTKIH